MCKPIPILLVGNKIDLRRPEGGEDHLEEHADAVQMESPPSPMQPQCSKEGESLAQILDHEPPPPMRKSGFPMSVINTTSVNFVSTKDGENLAKTLETEFIECSALDGTNVEAALLLLVA